MSRLDHSSFFVFALILLLSCAPAGGSTTEDHYYAVEINGTLGGYSHIKVSPGELDGKATTLIEQKLFLKLSLLGSEFDTDLKMIYHVDPATGQFLYHKTDAKQGRVEMDWSARVEGKTVRLLSSLRPGEKTVELTPDAILPNSLFMPHLLEDFVEGGATSKSYPILDVRDAELQETEFTLVGKETVELAGDSYEVVILESLNKKTGVRFEMSIDRQTGRVLEIDLPNNRHVYLAKSNVVKQIEMVNVDELIMSKTNVSIPDVQAITYMKVRAVFEPSGLWITPEMLNVQGQSFTGTVEENRIEGVFEIEHPHYDGAGAPPFPPDFGGDESLKAFLEPEETIESDDPVLIEQARKITEGSANSWEAVTRLAAWVAGNLDYAIPGGVTARRTYDTRTGECGAHSRLVTALSRAVGIPARVVWGCMYSPSHGGAFGQHGWNEVYMGQVGWIPLDATANEPDFADSGHIRIGVVESFATSLNPVEMEILDYRLGTGEPREVPSGTYDAYLGEYTNPESKRTVNVLVQDGSMAVDIPGQVVIALHDPDEDGVWYARLSNKLFFLFHRNDDDKVVEMELHELVRMQRIGDPEQIDAEVPDGLRDYLGTYLLPQLNAEFTVVYRDNSLAFYHPLEKRTIGLRLDDQGRWVDESGARAFSFERDDDGTLRAMVVDATARFLRDEDQEAVTAVKAMLTDFHLAAAEADGDRFFGHIAPDAILLGTDSTERFTLPEYKAMFGSYFEQGIGSTTVATEQNVYLSEDGKIAWFDERLDRPELGEMRGTGVARLTDGRWKLVQYNVSFPVPNALARKLMTMIRELPEDE